LVELVTYDDPFSKAWPRESFREYALGGEVAAWPRESCMVSFIVGLVVVG
jgi:hypothetical protein